MAGKREKPEDIVMKLRQVEVLQGQGMSVAEAVRQVGMTQQTYYRWRRQYGGMSRDQLKRLKELEKENPAEACGLGSDAGQADPDRGGAGKLLSPSRRRQCIDHVRQTLGVSERRACRTLGQHRSTQRKVPRGRPDEDRLTDDIIELATQYGRYGYRPVTALLNQAGWHVNHKRVERIWRREGLKVPQKQKKRSRLWLNDGSCIRLRPERPNHVWSYDFVQDRTHDGRPIASSSSSTSSPGRRS
jgi:putative transposase